MKTINHKEQSITNIGRDKLPRVPNIALSGTSGTHRRSFLPKPLLSVCSLCSLWLSLFLVSSATAQIQQAWVARYNNGITNGTNQAVKMVLDSAGNIYVTGFSQNSSKQLGYATIKYAPNGNQLWAARYDSTIFPLAKPVALALDSSTNAFITGTALTIKYDTNGNQLWTAPYSGNSLAVGPDGEAVVTGTSTNFGTVKLSAAGSNVWAASYPSSYAPGYSQVVVIDTNNNSYVSGTNCCCPLYDNGVLVEYGTQMLTIAYGSNGNQLWVSPYAASATMAAAEALDGAGNLYVIANAAGSYGYMALKYATNGNLVWNDTLEEGNGNNTATAVALTSSTNVLLTGQIRDNLQTGACTVEVNSKGSTVWTNLYPAAFTGTGGATGIAVDSANNCYVTGYAVGANSLTNIITIKYGPSGNQLWLQSYSSPGHGNAAGNAIAVDTNGNVYVAGYDTTTAGGTEMVLIKYWPFSIQKKSDGSILLQAQGSPGESFDIQASADLQNWLDLGNVIANTNGLMQYTDTNASNFAARFYYTNPQ